MAHAMLSPSGAKKWMNCPGSVALEAREPDDTSEYADEGTAAHELASRCLQSGDHPTRYLGTRITIVNGVYWPGGDAPRPPKLRGQKQDIERTFDVDTDMVAPVNAYVQKVREFARLGTLMVEQRLPVGHITGEKDATGTGDAVILLVDNPVGDDEIQVHDLKFGRGVRVSAERNPQLMTYALGALKKYVDENVGKAHPFKRARMVIHQPRLDSVSEWDCSIEDLMKWATAIAMPAAKDAMAAFDSRDKWIGKATTFLWPGPHCSDGFCKARATCPALAKFVTDTVGADFDVIAEAAGNEEALENLTDNIAPPADDAALGKAFASLDIIDDWIKAVRAKAEARLFEENNSPEIIAALGIKLVEGKRGNRTWLNAAEAEALLKKMRFKVEEIYDMKVISPTSAQKLVGDQPKRWAKLAELITQRDGSPSVVPAADKRPPLVLKPSADDFDVVAPAAATADVSDLV